jgi:hypothetical protein
MNELTRFGLKRLAGWWCELNSWKWPKDLPLKRPADMDFGNEDFQRAWRTVQQAIVWKAVQPFWKDRHAK